MHALKVTGAIASMLLSMPRGFAGTAHPHQPAKPIRLYEFEGCPYCRRVREVLTMLNLDVEIYPCPKKGTRFREQAQALGGKMQFPLLIDENTDTVLHESQDIIDYLFKTYSDTSSTPRRYRNMSRIAISHALVGLPRGTRGIYADTTNSRRSAPVQLLELWSFEASPYTRLVRERLCELEIPYLLRNVAKERWQDNGPAVLRFKPGKYVPLPGGKRELLLREVDKIQMPYLIDPNTGVRMHESKAILQYVNHQYAR